MTKIFKIDDLEEFGQLCLSGNFKALEGCIVEPDQLFAPKKWSKDLTKEHTMLMRQFGEGSALSFAVPFLTPYLRRKIDFDTNYAHFNMLWSTYSEQLLKELNSRWLVSTLDTYIKDPRSPQETAWAHMGAFFMKTIKLYETELLRLEQLPDLTRPAHEQFDEQREECGRIMLFEGIQAYNVKQGDMISKMQKRFLSVESDEICYKISCELWLRAHSNETIYKRMQAAMEAVNNTK